MVIFLYISDSECLSYEIYRYENTQADCQYENSSIRMLHSSDEYDCLEECLDTEGCRSITFNGENCSLHNCTETVSSVDSIFYKRECVKSEYSLKAIIMHKCRGGKDDAITEYNA